MRQALCLIVLLAALGVPAAAETPGGTLRLMLSSANPTGDWTGDFDIGGMVLPTVIEADSATAFGVVYEVRLGDRWGLESGIYFADFDFTVASSGLSVDFGSALAIPFTFGLDYHVFSGEQVDVYFGPQVSYTLWGNLDTPAGALEVDSDFGLGAVAGADFRIGKSNWTFSVAARYLGTSLSDASIDIGVDPLLAEVGVGYRF